MFDGEGTDGVLDRCPIQANPIPTTGKVHAMSKLEKDARAGGLASEPYRRFVLVLPALEPVSALVTGTVFNVTIPTETNPARNVPLAVVLSSRPRSTPHPHQFNPFTSSRVTKKAVARKGCGFFTHQAARSIFLAIRRSNHVLLLDVNF